MLQPAARLNDPERAQCQAARQVCGDGHDLAQDQEHQHRLSSTMSSASTVNIAAPRAAVCAAYDCTICSKSADTITVRTVMSA